MKWVSSRLRYSLFAVAMSLAAYGVLACAVLLIIDGVSQ